MAHPLNGLATLCLAQEKFIEAELLFQRSLSIREKALEPYHPDTADTLYGLATLRKFQGNALEAASLLQRALAIREQVFGPQHPETTETRERLCVVLIALSKTKEVEQPGVMQPEPAEMKEKLEE